MWEVAQYGQGGHKLQDEIAQSLILLKLVPQLQGCTHIGTIVAVVPKCSRAASFAATAAERLHVPLSRDRRRSVPPARRRGFA